MQRNYLCPGRDFLYNMKKKIYLFYISKFISFSLKENIILYGNFVYMDEIIQIGAGWTDSKVFNPITKKVWCTKTTSIFKPKEKAKLIKIWGKREAYKRHDLDKKIVSYVPYFNTYATFERQYKKLENLELITEL